MTRDKAIEVVNKYYEKQLFDWEIIPVIDNDPIELHTCRVFKNYYEPREPYLGSKIHVNIRLPSLKVDKVSQMI
ncbi:MAG: hypothetical protein AAF849_23530 [Bacteroidota bacterium]